jgi:hypothetical protein
MNWKGYGRKRSWPNLKYIQSDQGLPASLEGARECFDRTMSLEGSTEGKGEVVCTVLHSCMYSIAQLYVQYCTVVCVAYVRVVQLFSSLGPRIVFPLDPRAKKLLLALFLKTNSQFSLSLTILIYK